MIAIKAHYDGKVIVPDEPVKLPKGQDLLLHIDVVNGATVAKKPKKPKKGQSVLDWIVANRIKDDSLPVDLAHQHDHYLYGTPKKPPAKKRPRRK